VAPRSGQECQLTAPSKRHIENILELTDQEWVDFKKVLNYAHNTLGVGGDGVWMIRTGDPRRNAKSVPHLHFNFHLPIGKDRVEVTIAKSEADLQKKLLVLRAFEKYRVAEEAGRRYPYDVLTVAEFELIQDNLEPPKTAK